MNDIKINELLFNIDIVKKQEIGKTIIVLPIYDENTLSRQEEVNVIGTKQVIYIKEEGKSELLKLSIRKTLYYFYKIINEILGTCELNEEEVYICGYNIMGITANHLALEYPKITCLAIDITNELKDTNILKRYYGDIDSSYKMNRELLEIRAWSLDNLFILVPKNKYLYINKKIQLQRNFIIGVVQNNLKNISNFINYQENENIEEIDKKNIIAFIDYIGENKIIYTNLKKTSDLLTIDINSQLRILYKQDDQVFEVKD